MRLTKLDKNLLGGSALHLNYSDCGWITCNTRIVIASGKECNEVSGTGTGCVQVLILPITLSEVGGENKTSEWEGGLGLVKLRWGRGCSSSNSSSSSGGRGWWGRSWWHIWGQRMGIGESFPELS